MSGGYLVVPIMGVAAWKLRSWISQVEVRRQFGMGAAAGLVLFAGAAAGLGPALLHMRFSYFVGRADIEGLAAQQRGEFGSRPPWIYAHFLAYRTLGWDEKAQRFTEEGNLSLHTPFNSPEGYSTVEQRWR